MLASFHQTKGSVVAFFSRGSAAELSQKIAEARDQSGDTVFELAIVLISDGREQDYSTLLVREVRLANRLHDGREMVHCSTLAANRKIDILLPRPEEQQVGVAEIIIDGS